MVARHNCVVLPGLGALLAQEIPAFYNAKDGVFMPPHRTLGFNPQLITDDALLLTEYMGGGKLSYMEAGMALDRDMATLRKKLSATGVLHFGELGVFSMNINGEISIEKQELIETDNLHGSGCNLSSAITAYLAKNNDLHTSILKSLDYVYESIKNGNYGTLIAKI